MNILSTGFVRDCRLSARESFTIKIISEILDYSLEYDLLQFVYDRWLFTTVSHLSIHYPQTAFALKLRAYISSLLPFLKCRIGCAIF